MLDFVFGAVIGLVTLEFIRFIIGFIDGWNKGRNEKNE